MEGTNSLIQAAKAKARGYRSKTKMITIIYLIPGKLRNPPTLRSPPDLAKIRSRAFKTSSDTDEVCGPDDSVHGHGRLCVSRTDNATTPSLSDQR